MEYCYSDDEVYTLKENQSETARYTIQLTEPTGKNILIGDYCNGNVNITILDCTEVHI